MTGQRAEPVPDTAATDTLGIGGRYVDPLWRVVVGLRPLEQDLLRSWWVRRLAFVAHAGAAAMTTTQSYSRLEHSLGLLALVAHFRPDDDLARAAALVHDVGHLPLSHTLEGLAGLDHHVLGRARVRSLGPVFARYGLSADEVVAAHEGPATSCLHGVAGHLGLDHLDSFLRSGQAHGRTRTAPPVLLSRLGLVEGGVDTDAGTARELTDLVVGEAHAQRSPANVVASAVVRRLVELLLVRLDPSQLAAMTDDELWCALTSDTELGPTATRFRRSPLDWVVDASGPTPPWATGTPADIVYEVRRSYLDLPTVGGVHLERAAAVGALERSLPLRWRVRLVGDPR